MEKLKTKISWDHGVPTILLGTDHIEELLREKQLVFSDPSRKSLVIIGKMTKGERELLELIEDL